MQYIHVKNLGKYHPSYKDRKLKWCKLYFDCISTDPEFSAVDEVNQWRFFKFILMELQLQTPVPLQERYLTIHGFDLKTVPISLTLQMLQNFIEIVTEPLPRLDKIRLEKEKEKEVKHQEKESFVCYKAYESKKFQKPSLDELKTAFRERGYSEGEGQKFLDYYESVGWVVGASRKPMKNWRGAVATWCGKLVGSGVRPRSAPEDTDKIEQWKKDAAPMPDECRQALAKLGMMLPEGELS